MSALTDYQINDAPMVMDIRSDTLEPISGVQGVSNRFVFRLDQAGYLDANSMLLFKICNANNDIQSRVNTWNGGLGAVKRITFQVGDYVINDVNGCDIISTLMNLATQNPATRNHYSGWYYGNQLWTDVKRTGTNTGTFNADLGGVGSLFVDPNRSGLNDGANNNNNAGVAINSQFIRTAVGNTKQIGIPLGVLLPALRGKTIPLFLFQDYRIIISVEFNDGSEFINDITSTTAAAPNANTGVNNGLASPFNTTSGINFQDVKLQVDYIIMPSAVQNKDREMTNQQGGYRFDFFDILRIEKQIPAATANQVQEVEHRIGMDNKEVHKLYMTKKLQGLGNFQNKWFGNQRIDAMNQEEYNVNIDGIDIFPDFKFSPMSQYDETSNCLGADLQVPRPVYTNDDNTIFSCLSPSVAGLLGQYKPLCLDLTNGTGQIVGGGRVVGAYPIIWKYRRKPTAAVVNKQVALNGAMDVNYYALVSKTAIITSTPKGTNVVVSY